MAMRIFLFILAILGISIFVYAGIDATGSQQLKSVAQQSIGQQKNTSNKSDDTAVTATGSTSVDENISTMEATNSSGKNTNKDNKPADSIATATGSTSADDNASTIDTNNSSMNTNGHRSEDNIGTTTGSTSVDQDGLSTH